MQRRYDIGGQKVAAQTSRRGETLRLEIGGREHEAALREVGTGEYVLRLDGRERRVWIAADGDSVYVHMDGRSWRVRAENDGKASSTSGGPARADVAAAPMPGTVIAVHVAEGEHVRLGQTLVVIESMKMETPVKAWRDGVVQKIHHALGATFDRNAPLVTLAPVQPAS